MERKLLDVIGILMIALGVSIADSEWLIIPIGFITMGFIVMGIVERKEK